MKVTQCISVLHPYFPLIFSGRYVMELKNNLSTIDDRRVVFLDLEENSLSSNSFMSYTIFKIVYTSSFGSIYPFSSILPSLSILQFLTLKRFWLISEVLFLTSSIFLGLVLFKFILISIRVVYFWSLSVSLLNFLIGLPNNFFYMEEVTWVLLWLSTETLSSLP